MIRPCTSPPETEVSSAVLLEDAGGSRKWIETSACALIAILLHAAAFLVVLPESRQEITVSSSVRELIDLRHYVPPPPPPRRRPLIERVRLEAVPLPDPTPDDPEPLVPGEPDPVVDTVDTPLEVVIGEPEPPPAPPALPRISGIGGVSDPELIVETRVEPAYPELARRARIEGRVVLQIVVRRDGTVGPIEVLGRPSASLGFVESAVAAVRQWRYHPATLDDRPVDVYVTVVVSFEL